MIPPSAHRRRTALAAAGAALLLAFGPAAAAAEPASAWRELARDGGIVLLRHAQTEAGIGDPPGYRLDDCASQRNLSAAGRAQAQRIGAAFAANGVRVDEVHSSPWCRCVDTARLAFAHSRLHVDPRLGSFFDDRSRAAAQTAAARALIAERAARGRTIVLVTHQVNIAALAGRATAVGEALVLRWQGGAAEPLQFVGVLPF